MEITRMQTKAFWKGEVGISGQVRDGGKSYDVRLDVRGSDVNSCSCSCAQGHSYRGMCPHERALFEAYLGQAAQRPEAPASTSAQVRAMIREYTNGAVAEIMGEDEEGSVTFAPRLSLGREGVRAEFRLVRGRQYVIKDLIAFAGAVEQRSYVEYGKHLAFCHARETFAGESQGLLGLALEMVGTYVEHGRQFQKGSYGSMPMLRELDISRSWRDRFFALLAGQVVDGEDPAGANRKICVIRRNPQRMVALRRAGANGIKVSMDRETFSFCGETRLYVQNGGNLYICDEDFSRDAGAFFRQMPQGGQTPCEVTVSERDVPLFYERVLRKLEAYGLLDAGELDLEAVRPAPLMARFDLENPAPGRLALRPSFRYGGGWFHPVAGEDAPRDACRDVPGEFRISQVLTRYFKYKDLDTGDLVIRDDEEGLYRFLSEGVPKLQALGEVRFPKGEHALKILEPPKVSVGVQVTGEWLDLTIDPEGLSVMEMMKILEAYRRKKPYYRLKSGEFLRLEDNGLVAVAQMMDGFEASKKELGTRRIRIPRSRALYLDALCRQRRDVLFLRDRAYEEILRGMRRGEDGGFEIPEGMEAVLRGYQKTGFQWLKTLDACGFGGLLADDMGLGKTIQIISILADAAAERRGRAPDEGLPERGSELREELPGRGIVPVEGRLESCLSLVVCPASLVYNWEREMETFAPDLKTLIVAGTSAEREERLGHAGEYDVVVTSYDLLRRDWHLYEGRRFRFQILDEAQYIKNPDTLNARAVKSVRSGTRYALTGTPVENRLSELWSIFDYLMPGFLSSYQRFKKDYEGPIVKEGDEEALKRLRQMTAPFILRRLKRDVLKELPGKLESVVYSRMEKEQRELYDANAWQLKQELAGQDRMRILAGLMRLRQVCCDPGLVYEDYRGGSAKLETCMELVSSGILSGHRILLFSQFASMLRLIGARMEREGIGYHLLTGETPKEERRRMTDSFGRDDTPVFLISLKAGGTGLNLTAADMVILYDPWWNTAAQNQAADRAHRIGQERQVVVFRLITRDTVEENIVKLQKAKEQLAGQVVAEGMVPLGSLSEEELMGLLEQGYGTTRV